MMKSDITVTTLMLLLAMLYTGCAKKTLNEDELKAYIQNESNQLTKTVQADDYRISVSYRPQELLMKQEMNAGVADTSALQEKYGRNIYFILSLSKGSREAIDKGSDTYSDLIRTLSFRMSEMVSLTTSDRDTLRAVDYVFPRTYGYSGANNLMFAFPVDKITKDQWLQFNLEEFGLGLGLQTFRFEMEDIANIPHLAILQ